MCTFTVTLVHVANESQAGPHDGPGAVYLVYLPRHRQSYIQAQHRTRLYDRQHPRLQSPILDTNHSPRYQTAKHLPRRVHRPIRISRACPRRLGHKRPRQPTSVAIPAWGRHRGKLLYVFPSRRTRKTAQIPDNVDPRSKSTIQATLRSADTRIGHSGAARDPTLQRTCARSPS
jgi:hypothetical protein